MRRWLVGVMAIALCLVAAQHAGADERIAFQQAVAQVSLHYQAALDRLQARDADGTTAELSLMRTSLQALIDRFGAAQAAASAEGDGAVSVTEIDARIVAAMIVIGIGRPAAARDALVPIGDMLSRLRAREQSPKP